MIAVAAAAAFLATFNETFLNVALTPIMNDFGITVGTVQWLATGYLLVAAIFVPVSNVLYRRFSTRPLFVSTVALLVVGSLIGALAPTFEVLLAGRLLQAVGTGLLIPVGMNVALAVAPRHKLGLVMGIMAELSRPKLDVWSFVLVALALGGLLYGISTVFGGSLLIALCAMAVGVAALIVFVVRQQRIASPLIDLRPLRSKTFVIGMVMTMLGLLFVFAMNVVIPVFLQTAKGLTPLGASLALAPGILLTVAMGPIAGRMFDRHGGKLIVPLGFLVMAIFCSLVGWVAGGPSVVLFGLLYVPAVLSTAFVIGPAQTFALAQLDRETGPHGVTLISTSFQIAGCVGTSLGLGIYGAIDQRGLSAGVPFADASLHGFQGAVLLVVVASLIGVALAIRASRLSQRATVAA